jgi:hypothetical protein
MVGKIEEKGKEIMSKIVEAAVASTAKTVESWLSNLKAIEAQIADANSRLEKSEERRKQFALAASLHDPAATKEIATARIEHAAAIGDIADLGHALIDANSRLIEAEREAKAARHELALDQATTLMHKRVSAAAKFDEALAACAAAFDDYQRLGAELQSYPDLNLAQGGAMMAHWEDATGLKRLAAALPAFLKTLPAWTLTHHAKFVPLAQSESQFWSLPAEQPEAKAA